MSEIVLNCIRRIREYTCQHPELQRAHHFVFDIQLSDASDIDFMIVGLNPGEQPKNWELTEGKPSEETSQYNFFDNRKLSRSAARWRTNAIFFCGTDRVVLSDFFFWSSKNMVQFAERFGKFESSPHLPFCKELNLALIEHYGIKAVISPGLNPSHMRRISEIYGLRHIESLRTTDNRHRLIESYIDVRDRFWIFTKHWSGAFGFSDEQRRRIRDYISDKTR